MSRTTRFTSVLTLTLCAALAACDSPTSIGAPLAPAGVLASAKPDAELCRAHWQELKTSAGAAFQNIGDCIRYDATGGIFENEPQILWVGYSAGFCTITDGPMFFVNVHFINGTGVIDYGTGPQPYTSDALFAVSWLSPPLVTITVTNAIGQVATGQFTPTPPGTNPCGA